MMYKNIHIFPREKFTIPFIKFINKNFSKEENIFIIYGNNKTFNQEEIHDESNVIKIEQCTFKEFRAILKNSKNIIIHSMFITKKITIYLWLCKKQLTKACWVFWGGDITSAPKDTIKSVIYEKMKKQIIQSVSKIGVLMPKDVDIIKQKFKLNASYIEARYVNPIPQKNFANTESNINRSIKIQLGNSASKTNNHFESIDLIKTFIEEDIKVYIPLSYGDMEYAKEVKKYARRVLKDKVVFLEEFMEPEKYGEFLEGINIGIFNYNRQQGLGNIMELLRKGKKIYLRFGTSTWNELVDNLELKIENIQEIKKTKFSDFARENQQVIEYNRNIVNRKFNENETRKIWSKILE